MAQVPNLIGSQAELTQSLVPQKSQMHGFLLGEISRRQSEARQTAATEERIKQSRAFQVQDRELARARSLQDIENREAFQLKNIHDARIKADKDKKEVREFEQGRAAANAYVTEKFNMIEGYLKVGDKEKALRAANLPETSPRMKNLITAADGGWNGYITRAHSMIEAAPSQADIHNQNMREARDTAAVSMQKEVREAHKAKVEDTTSAQVTASLESRARFDETEEGKRATQRNIDTANLKKDPNKTVYYINTNDGKVLSMRAEDARKNGFSDKSEYQALPTSAGVAELAFQAADTMTSRFAPVTSLPIDEAWVVKGRPRGGVDVNLNKDMEGVLSITDPGLVDFLGVTGPKITKDLYGNYIKGGTVNMQLARQFELTQYRKVVGGGSSTINEKGQRVRKSITEEEVNNTLKMLRSGMVKIIKEDGNHLYIKTNNGLSSPFYSALVLHYANIGYFKKQVDEDPTATNKRTRSRLDAFLAVVGHLSVPSYKETGESIRNKKENKENAAKDKFQETMKQTSRGKRAIRETN